MRWRDVEEAIFRGLMILSLAAVVASLLLIAGVVLVRGLPALDLAMLLETPKGGSYLGKEGGILNAIVGSLYVAGGGTLLAGAVGFAVVVYLHGYARDPRLSAWVRLSLDILWGVPSIVIGAFMFVIMLSVGARASLLWGILTIAVVELPVFVRAIDEVMGMTPHKLKEAAYSLGATRFETVMHVVARQALPGILTGVLLAFGRGIGDAASVLFTAGYTDSVPTSINDPVATLPLAIFFQLGTPFPDVQRRAYACGIVLFGIILLLSVLLRLGTTRLRKYVIR